MLDRTAAAVLVLLLAALAGCSAPAKEEGPSTDFSDLPIQVSETTGAVRGVVVDERLVPVEGVTVTLRGSAGGDQSSKTDSEGRFVFSGLQPGTYFLGAGDDLHKPSQTSVEVVAGVDEPPLTRILIERLFTQDPYSVQVIRDGFFECSQDGASVWYSSSNCSDGVFGPASDVEPSLSNVTTQTREWHSDVPAGWQVMVFEMRWEPTSQGTSPAMGMVVSTYKPTREGTHWFAEFESSSPLRGELDVGVEHESASGVKPTKVPAEGMANMSYFVSVRGDGPTPGIALNQKFTVYLTQFIYGKPKDGWSIVAGDELPF